MSAPLTNVDLSTLTAEERAEYDKAHSLQAFIEAHQAQFEAIKLPKYLWKVVHRKLYEGKYAVQENTFTITPAASSGSELKAAVPLRRWADVWLAAHPFVATKEQMIAKLQDNKDLFAYLWAVFDMDSLIQTPEEAAAAKKAKAEAAAKAEHEKATAEANRAAAAAAVGSHEEADPLMVTIITEQTGASESQARAALLQTQNDLVEALALCGPKTEEQAEQEAMAKEVEARFTGADATAPQTAEAKAAAKAEADAAAKAEAEAAAKAAAEEKAREARDAAAKDPETEQEKQLQRILALIHVMFQGGYAGMMMTAAPRGPNSPYTGPLHPDEITRLYYVPDEVACAVGFATEPNFKVEPLMLMTVKGVSVTLMWADKDVPVGGVCYQAQKGAIKNPFA